ncbi:MAG: MATE family efflux transporter [Bacteroidales bacterium]|nr:MATE family efflux transporter [Bacteroidales bacterium]
MRPKDNHTFLTTAPVGKVILTMAVPTVISMLVTSMYNMVDTFFVGRISTQATAAVGLVFPVMTVIQAFGFFFGQGSGTYISRMLGARNREDASCMAVSSLVCSIVFGMVLAALGLIFLDPLSRGLGASDSLLQPTKDFLGIILIGAPFFNGSLTLNNQIRFQGNAAYSMFGILSGALLNVIAVPLFIFAFGMGVKGAALGTVIGQITGFFVLLAMSFKGDGVKLKLKDFSFEWKYYSELFKGGTPSLTRQGMASIATLLLNVSAGAFGDAAIAGMSIVSRISLMVFSFILGLGQGFQPVCGFSYGAGLYDRVKKGYFFCLQLGTCVLLACCIPGFIFSDTIVDIMRHDPEVVAVGMSALRWQVLTWPLAAFITFSNMTLQTSARTIPANILAACRNGIFFIPLIIILPHFFGLLGVEMCQSICDFLSFLVGLVLMVRYFRSLPPHNLSR